MHSLNQPQDDASSDAPTHHRRSDGITLVLGWVWGLIFVVGFVLGFIAVVNAYKPDHLGNRPDLLAIILVLGIPFVWWIGVLWSVGIAYLIARLYRSD